jgi:hypothetical protein
MCEAQVAVFSTGIPPLVSPPAPTSGHLLHIFSTMKRRLLFFWVQNHQNLLPKTQVFLFYLLNTILNTLERLRIFNHFDLLPVQPTFKAFQSLQSLQSLETMYQTLASFGIWLETPYQTLYIMVMSVKKRLPTSNFQKNQAYVVVM